MSHKPYIPGCVVTRGPQAVSLGCLKTFKQETFCGSCIYLYGKYHVLQCVLTKPPGGVYPGASTMFYSAF